MRLKKNPYLQSIIHLEILVSLLLLPLNAWAQNRVKIALWGDSRENEDGACEDIADILLHQITDWDFQIHTGDFTSDGSEADWQRSLGYKGIDSLFVPGKFFMCTSNHDDVMSTYDKYTAGVLPVNSADSTTHFYSYKKENVHIIACDAYFTDATTMQNWLDQELTNIPADDWLIGFWHSPCYGDITYKSSYLDKCAPWLEKFHARGGDFIFHGHAHVYVRTHPLLPDGTVDHENGMVHVVNGCGGANWKQPQTKVAKTAFTPDTTSFAVITFITIEGDTARLQTIDARPGRNLAVIDEAVCTNTQTVDPKATLQAPSSNDQDDMCIWIHPTDQAQSMIIASDKDAYKLFVYDLEGDTIQSISVPGQPGNIDVRYRVPLNGQQVDIVAYNDRDNDKIVIYAVDPLTRQLERVDNDSIGTGSNYGICLYRSPISGKVYAFTADKDGWIKQFELIESSGHIAAIKVRTWDIGGQTEGCVCDDETAQCYFGEEDRGIWKIGAEPGDPTSGTLIAKVNDPSGLKDDVEGVTLYYSANGAGYIIASSQGNSTFKLYSRQEPHNHITTFQVSGASSTDGIDVTNMNLAPAFPEGIFCAHSGGAAVYVCDLGDIDGIILDTDYWNPRASGCDTTFTLTVNITGSGSVTPPSGSVYCKGVAVELTARRDFGSVFDQWSGDLTGPSNPDTVIMDSDKNVTAVFVELQGQYELDVGVSPIESGAATSDPEGPIYDSSATVILTAVPAAGWRFGHWSGDWSGSANPDTITMDSHKHIVANFTQIPRYNLVIQTVGEGAVSLNPPGGTYYENTEVVLTAVPSAGWVFEGWSGDLNSAENPDTVAVDSAMSITATFNQISGVVATPGLPTEFALHQNYPNPFNPSTTIRFDLPVSCYVTLKVHDITGKVVSTLIDGFQAAGTYTVELDAIDSRGQELSSGIYFYKLRSSSFTKTRKMVLLR